MREKVQAVCCARDFTCPLGDCFSPLCVMRLYLPRPLLLSPSFSFSAVPPFPPPITTTSLLLPVDGLLIDVVVKREIDTDWMLYV